MQGYVDEIKNALTGGVLDLEISDNVIVTTVNSALREIQRYIDTTQLVTIPYSPCIDMSEYNVSSVSRVFRSRGYIIADTDKNDQNAVYTDPMYMGMWQVMSGYGNIYNLNNWVYNYSAWNTALQIRNTISTDLNFRYDKASNKLYINCAFDTPDNITIEYIPVYTDVSQVKSNFWEDILLRLSLALTKVIIGRIRTKFTQQSNALWGLSTDILTEGQEELNSLREQLRTSTQLTYGID